MVSAKGTRELNQKGLQFIVIPTPYFFGTTHSAD